MPPPITTSEIVAFVKQVYFVGPWSRPKAGGKKFFLGSHSENRIKTLYDHLVDSAEHLKENCNIRKLVGSGATPPAVSSYIPEPIRTNIIRSLDKRQTFVMEIQNRGVQRLAKIHFVYSKLSNRFIYNALYKIYLWLSIVFSYASLNCGKELDLFIYFTEDEKKLPQGASSHVIDRQHVNTAFTTSCRPKIDIHIFRKEEWFKVFLHESFHCFGFDFSEMDSIAKELENQMIKPRFGLKSALDLRVYETYTETWANIINVLFTSYFWCVQNTNSTVSPKWGSVFHQFEKSLKQEQLFSIFQCCKVLSYNGLSYRDVCNGSMGDYTENSHVFAYYVLKSVLLCHIDEFVEWCGHYHRGDGGFLTFRKTGEHVQRFYQWLMNLCCLKEYVVSVLKMEEWMLANIHKKQYKKIRETLRMTVYG